MYIKANNKTYGLTQHALDNMRRRFISEDDIIRVLEEGELTQQLHGTDLYELDEIQIAVVVNEDQRIIVTVIDTSKEA